MLIMIVVLGVYPNLIFQVMDPAVDVALQAIGQRPVSVRVTAACSRSCPGRSPTSTTSPSRPRSCWPRSSAACSSSTSSCPSGRSGRCPRWPGSACSRRSSRSCSLAVSDDDVWSMFGGAYVVDDFALVLKALFVLSAYVVVLMSTNYIEEGDYYQGEYYFLLVTAVLGMVMMSSSRDLDQHLRGPGVPVDPGLHAGGVAQARREEQRGRRQVLPARGVRVGRDALRHVAVLRRHQHHAARRDQPEPGREPRTSAC